MRKAAKIVLIISSAILALVVTLILAGIAASGVISIGLTHAFFWIALAVAVLGASSASYESSRSLKHVAASGVLTFLIVGFGLLRLNSWLEEKKAEQDAANKPPTLPLSVLRTPRPPKMAMDKTPKELESTKGNNNVVGSSVKGKSNITGSQVCPGGICAGGDITGSPSITTIVAPRGRVLPDEKIQSLKQQLRKIDKISIALVDFEPVTNEMDQLTKQLQEIFREASWGEVPVSKIDIRRSQITNSYGPDNIVSNEPDGMHCTEDSEGARTVMNALSSVGPVCVDSPSNLYPIPTPKPDLTIYIGRDLSI